MSEYKVKFKGRVRGLFGPTFESIEIYEADSAKDALRLCKEDYEQRIGIDEDDVDFTLLDVEEVA